MILSTLSVLTSILILYLHHTATPNPISDTAKALIFNGLATAVCMRGNVPESTSSKVAPDQEQAKVAEAGWVPGNEQPSALLNHDLQIIADDLSFIAQRMKKQDRDEDIIEQWRTLARMLDRIFFWISVVYIVIILLVCLARQDPDY
jgi:hypothetical protein